MLAKGEEGCANLVKTKRLLAKSALLTGVRSHQIENNRSLRGL
jgi:hypothetical protein